LIGPPSVVTDLASVETMLSEWRSLAGTSARAPLDSPDWLLPLARRYLSQYGVRFLAWREAGELAGVAPLSLVADRPRYRPLRELALWGSIGPRMRGLVDVVARDESRAEVLDSLAEWLATSREWDLFRVVRPQVDSATPPRLKAAAKASGWTYAPYANVRSTTYQLDMPDTPAGWDSHLGSKARKVMRWELRKFAEFKHGRIEAVAPERDLKEALEAVARLLHERWGESEVYFARDPRFGPFVHEAVSGMAQQGAAWVTVARDDSGIQGVLVSLVQNGWAMALTVAMTTEAAYRPFSLGKHLFDAGLAEAVRRGCHTYDFLWVGGYKESFWHAQPRFLESAMVGRGLIGRTAARVLARREGAVGSAGKSVPGGNTE
jgi:CelD/BcsL family acetyltransferase involved in cellulose biosynthesis